MVAHHFQEWLPTQHRADMTRLQSEFAGMKATIENTPSPGYSQRPAATGSETGSQLADC